MNSKVALHEIGSFFRLIKETVTHADKRKRFLINSFLFIRTFIQRLNKEGIFKEAAALTFISVLAFIPFVLFIFLLLPEIPLLNFETHLRVWLIKVLVPSSAEQVLDYVSLMLEKKSSFNAVNFVMLLLTSYSLYKVINDVFDKILKAEQEESESIISSLLKFLGMIVFGFIFIVVLFSSSSLPVLSTILRLPLLKQQLAYFLPFILQFILFCFMYQFIPTTKVDRRSLLIGALVTTIIWMTCKTWFDWYILHLTNMKAIYGYLASVPVLLTWVYMNWIIVLGGMIVISIGQSGYFYQLEPTREDLKIKLSIERVVENKRKTKLNRNVKLDELVQVLQVLMQDEVDKTNEIKRKEHETKSPD